MDPMPVREDTKYPINWDKSWHYHFNSLTNRTQTRSKVIYKDHTCHILIILSSLHQANLIKYEEKIRGFSFISWIHSCSAIYSHTDRSLGDWHYFTLHIMEMKSSEYLYPLKPVADPWFSWGGGANSQMGCANLLFCNCFAENCMKMKEFGPLGHVSLAPPPPPPESANGNHLYT